MRFSYVVKTNRGIYGKSNARFEQLVDLIANDELVFDIYDLETYKTVVHKRKLRENEDILTIALFPKNKEDGEELQEYVEKLLREWKRENVKVMVP